MWWLSDRRCHVSEPVTRTPSSLTIAHSINHGKQVSLENNIFRYAKFSMSFLRHLYPKSVSPPEIFPFSTIQNYPILHPKFSDDHHKNYSPSHFKEKFPLEIFR